jgi:hypothetical protein
MSVAQGSSLPGRPRLWWRISLVIGNILQLIGMLLGALLLRIDAGSTASTSLRALLMIVAWILIYISSHAIAHWAVGRLVGIRFRGYGIRGTDHPENYPPGLRQLMSWAPFFTVLTDPSSMRHVKPLARALMFGAGETATTICTLAAAGYAWESGIPGGRLVFIVTVVWDIVATIGTAVMPRGDYAKARRALREGTS